MGSLRASQTKLWPIVAAVAGAVAACGSPNGEPLVSGEVSGSYDGSNFTMHYGFAIQRNAVYLIALGSREIDCSSVNASEPPSGDSAAIPIPSLAVGTYSNVLVQLYHNISGFTGTGSNRGQLMITQSATTVTGNIAYSDTISSKRYALNGTFEVIVCP